MVIVIKCSIHCLKGDFAMSNFIQYIVDLLSGGFEFIAGVIDFLVMALQVTLWWNVGDVNIIPIFMVLPVLLAIRIIKMILKGGK